MKLFFLCTVLSCVVLTSAIPRQHSYLVPERRSEVVAVNANSALPYEYQIVPSSEYAVSVQQPGESSMLDYILSPITAVTSIGSSALLVAQWVLVKGGLILLGISLVFAFCGLTSYCTMTLENPFSRGLPTIPYLDSLEYYFNEAYNKFHDMQKSL